MRYKTESEGGYAYKPLYECLKLDYDARRKRSDEARKANNNKTYTTKDRRDQKEREKMRG